MPQPPSEPQQPPGPSTPPPQSPQVPHPALRLLLDPSGRLSPEAQEFQDLLRLDPESLVPEWFPWHPEEDDQNWSPEERAREFGFELESWLSQRNANKPLTPPDVLRCLRQLRAVVRFAG